MTMFYTFNTKTRDCVITGPTLLTSASIYKATPGGNTFPAFMGSRSMTTIQTGPLQVTGTVAGEHYRFREFWDPRPVNITTIVQVARPLVAEELYNLIKLVPITITGEDKREAGQQEDETPRRLGPYTNRNWLTEQRHQLPPWYYPPPVIPPPPSYPANPPNPYYYPPGEGRRSYQEFTVTSPYMSLTYQNPFLQLPPIANVKSEQGQWMEGRGSAGSPQREDLSGSSTLEGGTSNVRINYAGIGMPGGEGSPAVPFFNDDRVSVIRRGDGEKYVLGQRGGSSRT